MSNKFKVDIFLDENLKEYDFFVENYSRYIKLLKDNFQFLLNKLGEQNWWPIYYNKNDKIKGKVEIIIGCVLTQNTSWKQVEKSLYNLYKNNLLSFNLIDEIEENRDFVISLIRPSGFATRKVDTLRNVLLWFKNNLDKYKKEKIRALRNELLSIKGIGKETADSILLYALDKPIFVIDNYTKKFFCSLTKEEIKNYDFLRVLFEASFFKEKDTLFIFKEYHALIVEEMKRKKTLS